MRVRLEAHISLKHSSRSFITLCTWNIVCVGAFFWVWRERNSSEQRVLARESSSTSKRRIHAWEHTRAVGDRNQSTYIKDRRLVCVFCMCTIVRLESAKNLSLLCMIWHVSFLSHTFFDYTTTHANVHTYVHTYTQPTYWFLWFISKVHGRNSHNVGVPMKKRI